MTINSPLGIEVCLQLRFCQIPIKYFYDKYFVVENYDGLIDNSGSVGKIWKNVRFITIGIVSLGIMWEYEQ